MRLLRLPDEDELKAALFPGAGKQRVIHLPVHWKETLPDADGDRGFGTPASKSDTLAIQIRSFHIEEGPGEVEVLKVRGRHNGRPIMAGWIPATGESEVEYEEVT